MKHLALFFLLNFSFCVYAQNSVEIKGRVLDENKKPIESSTVFASVSKDSTLIGYTITDLKGEFSLKIKKQSIPFFIKISTFGYVDYSKHYRELENSLDLGEIIVKSISTNLKELVIIADVPPVRIKKDTLEFNVASFKIREGTKVEYLLKQLPGIEIDFDKKITINGKIVSQILVNGKPFFNENGKIALQKLPSELIDKVQVSKKKSKKEKLTKTPSTSEEMSINLTIDAEKNKGVFGELMFGYGSNHRYENYLGANYFKDKLQLGVMASANNVNAVGLLNDRIFDNMNKSGSNKSGGITKSGDFGVSYSDDLFKKISTNGDYFYNWNDFENKHRSTQINLLPTENFTTFYNSTSNQKSESHNANFSIDYNIDSNSTLSISPNLTKTFADNNYSSDEYSLDSQGDRLNQSNSKSQTNSKGNSFNNVILYTKNLGKPSQYFTASFINTNSVDEDKSYSESESKFFKNLQHDDVRKQYTNTQNISDKFILEMEYSQPIVEYLTLEFNLNSNWSKSINSNKVYDFDNQNYSLLNLDNTSYYSSYIREVKPITAIKFSTSKLNFSIYSGVSISHYDINANHRNTNYVFLDNYILPNLRASFNYNFEKELQLSGNYDYNISLQDARTLLAFEDLSDPLSTVKGNPDVTPNTSHSYSLGVSKNDFEKNFNYNFNVGSTIYTNKVVNSIVYDENKKRTSTFQNINGTYSYFLRGNWSNSHKIGENIIRYGMWTNYSYGLNKGLADGVMYKSISNLLSTRVHFNFDYGELFTLSPSYDFTVNSIKYNNYTLNSAINFSQSFGLQSSVYLRGDWVLDSDFGYTYNSNIASDYKRDFYLWNISLAYTFLKKRLVAKLKVYDVLNQNTSAIRTVSSTAIVDQENLILKRYIMFSLECKLENFFKKKAK